MDKALLCVGFLSGVVTSCHLDPVIYITSFNLKGLNGSCLQIPCNFRVKDGHTFPSHRPAGAVWIKKQSQFRDNLDYVIFNSSRDTPNYPLKIIGDLSQRNCTTLFRDLKTEYTDKYFFRVENEDFRSTASCDPISITVEDSPWRPSIEISGEQTETEPVTITCSAVTPCPLSPPQLTWNLQQGTPNIIETNSDGTFVTKIRLKVTPAGPHDGYNLTCSAGYPVNGEHKTAETSITLYVTYIHSAEAGSLAKWLPVLCAFILIALISLLVYIWRFKFRRPHSLQAQVQTMEEIADQELDQPEDGLHYGDISFNKSKNPKPAAAQQETVYSLVNVSQPNNSTRGQASETADIYTDLKYR